MYSPRTTENVRLMTAPTAVLDAKTLLFGVHPTPDDQAILHALTAVYEKAYDAGFKDGSGQTCNECHEAGSAEGYDRGYAAGAQDTAEALQ